MIKKLFWIVFWMFVIFLAYNASAAWNIHYWTADDVRQYQPRRIDLIGKTWCMQHIEGTNDVDNLADIGEKPLYFRMWTSPIPYVPGSARYGRANVRVTTDLKGEWVKLGQWRNWEANKPWRIITIPIWDEELSAKLKASNSLFMDVGDLTYIRKWVMYDGDVETVLIDHITPKPKPPEPDPIGEFLIESFQKVLDTILPKAEPEKAEASSGPPIPGG